MSVLVDLARMVLAFLLASLTVSQLAKVMTHYDALRSFAPAAMPEQGLLISIFGIVCIVGGVAYDRLREIVSDRTLMLFALVLGAVSTTLLLVPVTAVVVVARVGESLSHILYVIAAPVVAFALLGPRMRTVLMASWGTFFTVGFLLDESILTRLVDPTERAYWLMPAAVFAVGFVLTLLLFRAGPTVSRASGEETRRRPAADDALGVRRIVASIALSAAFYVYATMFLVWKVAPEAGLVASAQPIDTAALSTAALAGNVLAIVVLTLGRRAALAPALAMAAFLLLALAQIVLPDQSSELKFALLGLMPVAIFGTVGFIARAAARGPVRLRHHGGR
ncbi:MFS transporter [Salinarimonas ramus]|uniref:MFS transporter n=1 Tax=Salinarimonas ramus TaxID=690164 RepID=A0A917Q7Q9_9HYPH|nr:MFS transporter [Salinarimonas ramus]GGK28759.1 hypothetical protein GCM10011322_14010 [Salinarimonas ramus]